MRNFQVACFLAIAAIGSSVSLAEAQGTICLSAVPNACAGGVYNEEAVISYYTPIFELMAENPSLNPEGPGPANVCISVCEQQFRQNIASCRALPTDDPVIGEEAQRICIQVMENTYRQCLESCVVPN